MDKILSYEQYSQVLAAFKEGRARCGTNKLMTREELTDLIEAGKLYYAQIGDTLWLFIHENYFYAGIYYVPSDKPIEMEKQDMDVAVDLMGRDERYDARRDAELVAIGFEKRDKRLEYAAQLDEAIDDIRRQNSLTRSFLEKHGYAYGTATRADYQELRALFMDKIGRDRYVVISMTDAQLAEMEKHGRCPVIYDKDGRIVAAGIYMKSSKQAYGYLTATKYTASGLGGASYLDELLRSYEEGCTRFSSWVRIDNNESNRMTRHMQKKTGKFYWQFLYKANASETR